MTHTRRCLALLIALAFSLAVASYHYVLSDAPLSKTSSPNSRLSQLQDLPPGQRFNGPPPQEALTSTAKINVQGDKAFGIFAQVFVVSRPTRLDRRAIMERLRLALGISWSYVDAISHDEPVVESIIHCIRSIRSHAGSRAFRWPSGFAAGAFAHQGLGSLKSSLPSETSCFPPVVFAVSPVASPSNFSFGGALVTDASAASEKPTRNAAVSTRPPAPLTCAREDLVHGVKYRSHLPSFMLLTPAKIACWYSHLAAIQQIAHFNRLGQVSDGDQSTSIGPDSAFLVLEDDVDMEQDISKRLRYVWSVLPADWDVVFLGHCWSNESHYPALVAHNELPSSVPPVALHPSFAPKCTHAYAVNPASAHRLLLHLTYPPFAYSRALDQALAWLVESNRLKAFSVVPSLAVQHKGSGSDIDQGAEGTGSRWREHLEHSILGL